LNWNFFTAFPSRFPDKAGILSAWVGTGVVMFVTALAAVPMGVAAGVYLEEYAPKNALTTLIEINIANLAGVPSIVYGLMALGLFVYKFQFGMSILTAGLTLALLILPIVIMATREAIRTIPGSIREAAFAVGATKWQLVRHHILPYSAGGILTGVIIGLSRAIGESAPLITIGALTFIAFLPGFAFYGDIPVHFVRMAEITLHRVAHTGVQLGVPPAKGVSSQRRRRGLGAHGHDLGHERRGHLDSISVPKEDKMVETLNVTPDVLAGAAVKARVQDLSFYYGTHRVLKNITLSVAEKKVTALIGPSGCGKTTLLRCFNRMHDLYPGNRYDGGGIRLLPENTTF
jgi:phosphate ABC transporter permease subunit PstA